MKKTLYMETTEVPAERTAGEISGVLIAAGASQISTQYDNGRVTGLMWTMKVAGIERLFQMPARVEPVYKILLSRRSRRHMPAVQTDVRQQATRVAWRQLLRWVQAQVAMIECGMTEAGEVFFPYLQTPSGQSLFDCFKDNGMKLLEGPPQ